MLSIKNLLNRCKAKRVAGKADLGQQPPLAQMLPELRSWFAGPMGRATMQHEKALVDSLLNDYHGSSILYLSPVADALPNVASPFRSVYRVYRNVDDESHEFSAEKAAQEGEQGRFLPPRKSIVSAFDALPFDDESIDIVVLHHVLEFTQEPQAMLKEAARITNASGHIAIIAFNPASVAGIWSMVWGRVRRSSVSYRRPLLAYRLKDWMTFLDLTHLKTHYLCHTLPFLSIQRFSWVDRIGRWFERVNMPCSSIHCLVARKDKAAMRPLDSWKTAIIKRAWPTPAQPIRASCDSKPKIERHPEND